MVSNSITVYGTAWCGDCRRAKKVLDRSGVSYKYQVVFCALEKAEMISSVGGAPLSLPLLSA